MTPEDKNTELPTQWDDGAHLDYPCRQAALPKVFVNPPLDGEMTTVLSFGLPCCGIEIVLEHPDTYTVAQLGAFIREATKLREWARVNQFSECAVPYQPESIK